MKNKVIIIAEAGVNHNGSLELAKKLVDVAAFAGADYIKFQTFKAEKLVTHDAKKANYQIKNLGSDEGGQLEMLKKLEIPEEWHYDLVKYAKSKNIKFLSTGFDFESVDLLEKLNVDYFKIPSGEITNKPYLVHIANKLRPVIISTGMSTLFEISEAINILINNGLNKNQITVLHCNTEYPTPMLDVNLLAMNTIKKEFSIQVGYSDHTLGIEVPIAAVALGATIIEKHITLDKELPGPDHKASLEPMELIALVNGIRNIEQALGSSIKEPSISELKNIELARKSIVASSFIKKGEKFTINNITTKRPGTGLSPMKWDEVINKVASKDFHKDEQIIF
jgi:N,N'-diacetyllegionaminate synthase